MACSPDVPVVLEVHLEVDVLLQFSHFSFLRPDLVPLPKVHVLQEKEINLTVQLREAIKVEKNGNNDKYLKNVFAFPDEFDFFIIIFFMIGNFHPH